MEACVLIDRDEQVRRWRRQQILKAISSDYLDIVDKLAESDADLHKVIAAAECGCHPERLAEIFL